MFIYGKIPMIHHCLSIRKNSFPAVLLTGCLILGGLLMGTLLLPGCLGAGRDTAPLKPVPAEKFSPESHAWHTRDLKPDYLSLARELVAKGHFKVARVQLDQALKQGMPSAEIYTLKGICARETGDAKKARTWFDQAIGLDGEYAPALNHLGILQAMEKKYEPARTSFEKALGLDPANPDFFNNAGMLHLENGAYGQAQSLFEQALALAPDHRRAAGNLAMTLGHMGDFQKAFSLLLAHYPYGTACHNMGVVYAAAGEKDKSLQMFLAAKNTQPAAQAQVTDPLGPADPSAPAGIPGDTGNGIYSRIQDSLANGGE